MTNKPKPKQAHRTGTYTKRAKVVRDTANLNPATPCGMCGKTLAEHPNTKTGKPPSWDADHERPGDPLSPLRPVAATCNRAAGARLKNERDQYRTFKPTQQW
jgi:hypothetical protein